VHYYRCYYTLLKIIIKGTAEVFKTEKAFKATIVDKTVYTGKVYIASEKLKSNLKFRYY
jgi:hypothetical protein